MMASYIMNGRGRDPNPVDLRQFHPTREQIEAASRLLRYQPFILDEDRHTGVADVFLHSPDPTKSTPDDYFFDRRTHSEEAWNRAHDANRRLACMYDELVARIAQ